MEYMYHYDPDTKEYIGSSEMEYDPIDNKPMIPANATTIEPPEKGIHEGVVFNGVGWDIVPDHRGETYYKTWDDQGTEIKELGEEIPKDCFTAPPEKPLDVIEQEARAHRDALLNEVVDSMNPMRWETLTDTQKDAWRDYRQALLDVPQQEGFPTNIVWPEAPV